MQILIFLHFLLLLFCSDTVDKLRLVQGSSQKSFQREDNVFDLEVKIMCKIKIIVISWRGMFFITNIES